MTKFKSASIAESISNAIRGIKLAISSQRNFRIELLIALVVILSALLLKFSISDICILILVIALVLICEIINSVIEFTLDAVYKNNYSKLVEMAKDMSAGMVLLIVIISCFIGIMLFGKYILSIFNII